MSKIREQIAAKRAAASKSASGTASHDASASSARQGATTTSTRSGVVARSGDDQLEDRTLSSEIRKAARNGRLDISSFELQRIPTEVYTTILGADASSLSRPPTPPSVRSSRVDTVQPEAEELTSFKAADNAVEELEREMGGFGGLKGFDMRANRLTKLPETFADLLRLTAVDLSYNAFTAIPPALLLLPALHTLDLSHNSIVTIDLSSPISPSEEGLSYGAGFLSTSFSRQNKASTAIWPALRNLNLGFNKIDNEGLSGLKVKEGFQGLRVLNLEGNALRGEVDLEEAGLGADRLPELATLNMSQNRALTGTKGTIAQGAKVEVEGCGLAESSASLAAAGDQPAPDSTANPPRPRGNGSGKPMPTTTMTYRTCPAATFDSEPLKIEFDLYLPPSPSSDPAGHPLVIWFHGGGLLQGNKENLPPHFRRLPIYPYPSPSGGDTHVAVISPNYRLAPQVPILDILSDITELLKFVRTKLNDQLAKNDQYQGHKIDTSRICLSGGSAGGYLALVAGLQVPRELPEESVGGYRGEGGSGSGIKCIAPFYPITDLTDPFWATETNPVPWYGRSITHAEAKPHIDTKAPPVTSAISGGPRSILYMYMLQHALFPSLLFQTQKSVGGRGLDAFRPTPETLSITHRLQLCVSAANVDDRKHVPIYLVYGTADNKIQPLDKTVEILRRSEGELEVEVLQGMDHGYDEDEREDCESFREWLGKYLI